MTGTMPQHIQLSAVLDRETSQENLRGMVGLEVADLDRNRSAAVVTISRPAQHNALNLDGWTQLGEVFAILAADPTVRAVVIRGAGARAFSAGADISEFPVNRLTPQDAHRYNAAIARALNAVQALPVPVIAMIGGLAVGGGCELAAACDIRVASTHARFGIPIGRLGVILGLTETRAVAGALGRANLMYLVASGKLIDARQALAMGFVQSVVDREALQQEVCALVSNIVASSETTIRATKAAVALLSDPAVADDHPTLRSLHDQAYGGPDLKEGVAAFLVGREPRFTAERTN